MIVIPAIDLQGGRCVRLVEGRADSATVFGDDPVAMARRWAERGARRLHVVDLDGAFDGAPRHAALIRAMVEAVPAVPVEVGGGLRDLATLEAALGTGARWAVLGTAAALEPAVLEAACASVAGPDPRRGGRGRRTGGGARVDRRASAHGARAGRAARRPRARRRAIYTDVRRDGTGRGPNLEATAALAASAAVPVIASGGIARVDDLVRLAAIPNVAGAIVGRALYTGAVDLGRGDRRGGGLTAMLARRVIPCLDVKDGRVVKGVRFLDLADAGDPVEAAIAYDRQGADELVFLDITASHEGRATMLDVVRRTAEAVYLPLTVGGGLGSLEDVRTLLRAGADKVSLNTAAVARPELIRDAAVRFGSQCIVVAIDAKRRAAAPDPTFEVYTHGGRRPTGRDAVAWAREAVDLGAGEILLTSMDRDGTRDGYDLELTRGDRRGRLGPGDRLGRGGDARPPSRRPRPGQGRRRARGLDLPLRRAQRAGGQAIPPGPRGAGPPRGGSGVTAACRRRFSSTRTASSRPWSRKRRRARCSWSRG